MKHLPPIALVSALVVGGWCPDAVASDFSPVADIFGGPVRWREGDETRNGWGGSLALHPWGGVGLVVDLGFTERYGYRLSYKMAGIRCSLPPRRVAGYVQLLFSGAIVPGIGIEYSLHPRVAVRLAGDLMFIGDNNKTYTDSRVSAGLTFRIGGHRSPEASSAAMKR